MAEAPDAGTTKELLKTFAGTLIWVSYFLKSLRVKNTFTRGRIEQVA